MKEKLSSLFYGGYCDDIETLETIKSVYNDYGYLCDTHTAVALGVYKKYVADTKDNAVTVIASTASPYKFPKSVLKAIGGGVPEDDFEALDTLSEVSGVKIPSPIQSLRTAKRRFNDVIDKNRLSKAVFDSLNI